MLVVLRAGQMMDWPLTAAVGTLAVVIGAVGYGAVALIRMESPQAQRPILQRPAPATASLQPASKVQLVALAPSTEYLTQPVNQPQAAPQLALPATSVFAPPSERPLPSVVALAPAMPNVSTSNRPARPHRELALPKFDNEPPPKVAKPVAVPPPGLAAPAAAAPVVQRGVMTPAEIAKVKGSLRLTSEQ